jgi:FkbM family methyltransferase
MTARRLGSLLSKLIPDGLSLPVLAGPLRGAKWIAGAAAGGGKGLSVVFNRAEPEQLATAEKLAPAGGICLDIGANVGLYTLLLARGAAHVFAFEPFPRNIGYLCRTLEVNRVRNVTVISCAVAEAVALASFAVGDNCALGRLSAAGDQPVVTISVDAFAAAYGIAPSLMKIDVEGAELAVLKGARDTLARRHPVILLSTHGDDARRECLQLLTRLEYDIAPLNRPTVDDASEFAATYRGSNATVADRV